MSTTELISVIDYDPTYPTYPVFAVLSLVLLLIPSYWHFKARNIGTSLYIIWTTVGILIYLINSVVWYGNMEKRSRFWCDLCTKLMVGLSVGSPAASLIINRRLYMIASVQSVHVSKSEGRKNSIIELAIGIGMPVLVMILHVISQGHRYDIIENVGCWPSTYITPVALATVFMWPILLGMISFVYACLSIRAFLKQRKAFLEVLQTGNSGLNVNRYFRLMALAGTEIAFSLPLSIYILITNAINSLHPWVSWANTHYDFNRTEYVPFGIFSLYHNTYILMNVSRYAPPAGGIFFFLYLGLSGESGTFLKGIWVKAGKFLGFEMVRNVSPGASWVARPGVSAGSQARSLPPFATTQVSFTTTTSSHVVKYPSADCLPHTPGSDSASSQADDEKYGDEKFDMVAGDRSSRHTEPHDMA